MSFIVGKKYIDNPARSRDWRAECRQFVGQVATAVQIGNEIILVFDDPGVQQMNVISCEQAGGGRHYGWRWSTDSFKEYKDGDTSG